MKLKKYLLWEMAVILLFLLAVVIYPTPPREAVEALGRLLAKLARLGAGVRIQ